MGRVRSGYDLPRYSVVHWFESPEALRAYLLADEPRIHDLEGDELEAEQKELREWMPFFSEKAPASGAELEKFNEIAFRCAWRTPGTVSVPPVDSHRAEARNQSQIEVLSITMSDSLLDAYRDTQYVVEPFGRGGGVRFELRVGERNAAFDLLLADDEAGPTTWAMLTAYNPGSRRRSGRENQNAHRRLKRQLEQSAARVWVGHGRNDDGTCSEPMWLATGIPLATALELGRKFGQNAILFGEVGGPAKLLVSEDGRDESRRRQVPRPVGLNEELANTESLVEAAGQLLGRLPVPTEVDAVSRYKVILKVGAEGGDVTLLGMKSSGEWRFKVSSDDHSPELIDEEPVHSSSKTTSSWSEALSLLGRYPWQRLYPIEVHPEFRAAVWEEISRAREPNAALGSGSNTGATCAGASDSRRADSTCRPHLQDLSNAVEVCPV